ncbi:hypothetical protein BLOT_015291 [Blomia tropicalis]|nr:hypothetical protein BLOT_015291 [Blomia tropicalis]
MKQKLVHDDLYLYETQETRGVDETNGDDRKLLQQWTSIGLPISLASFANEQHQQQKVFNNGQYCIILTIRFELFFFVSFRPIPING